MKEIKEKSIINSVREPFYFANSKLTRKQFIRGLIVAGLFTQIPISSCSNKENSFVEDGKLNNEKLRLLTSIQEILFPKTKNSPSASDVNADKYLLWILSDENKSTKDKKYIIDGLSWVNQTSIENYDKDYLNLDSNQQNNLVKIISDESWGRDWLSIIITYIIEAVLADPLYEGNIDELGWKWLNHNPGNPRPRKEILYGNIKETLANR